ncbi:MAG TPA: polysaccharide deacetylase family protein [Rhizomicrobium sp.]|jgi:peptidoglycan/xylan/chitin deacetylase (PgdA/CDA1 family)|nr:polysaccharide deacetylase family protein [Rhizomicrobium sp.]
MKRLAAALLFCALSTPAAASEIALTFDDLPSHSVLPAGETRIAIAQKIIAALAAARTPPVYGFVNGIRLVDDPASAPVLALWRDAGFPLGNHTWSHMNLNQHAEADWEADTLKNEATLAPLMANGDWRWLRYPFLAEGDTPQKRDAARAFLAAHRYRIAAVTLSFDDYLWNEPYARCIAAQDAAAIALLETAYLGAAETDLAYEHMLSLRLYGRDIPYVLLLHLGAFDARMLPRLLALYQSEGARFVSLADAERDPFYAIQTDPGLPAGPANLEFTMVARGIPLPARVVQVLPFDALCR